AHPVGFPLVEIRLQIFDTVVGKRSREFKNDPIEVFMLSGAHSLNVRRFTALTVVARDWFLCPFFEPSHISNLRSRSQDRQKEGRDHKQRSLIAANEIHVGLLPESHLASQCQLIDADFSLAHPFTAGKMVWAV